MLAFVAAVVAIVTPTAHAAAPLPAPPVAAVQAKPGHLLKIFSDYSNRAVVEIVDPITRRVLSRTVDGHAPVEQHAEGATRAAGPSNAQRCSNSGSSEEFNAGVPQPWRMSEKIHYNAGGVPASRSSDWRTMLRNAKTEWEKTVNPCSMGDLILWDMPESWDTATQPGCSDPDGENVVGFANLGGWGNGLLLARTCVWFGGGFIYEADMAINNHSDASWCNACSSQSSWDLQSVAAHEFGHMLGLGHTENGASRETAAAVMHPIVYTGDTRNRTLSRGDVYGAMALYPRLWGYEFVNASMENPAGPGVALEPNRTYAVTVDVRNTGYLPWRVGDITGMRVSTYPLGTCSQFAGADWTSCSLASFIDEDLSSEFDEENTSMVVAQGETARMRFTIPTTWAQEGVSSIEKFVIRGGAVPVPDSTPFSFGVSVGTYKVGIVSQSGPGLPLMPKVILRGTSSAARLVVKNEGTAPWFPGDGRLRLITSPDGRVGRFAGSDWESTTVASLIDRPETGIVLPGEEATFDFYFYAGLNVPHGTTSIETFEIEVAGRPVSRMDRRSWFRLEVW